MAGLADVATALLLGVGGLFCLLGAAGIVVMPDVYNRMQAASKAVTLGASSTAMAAAVHFGRPEIVCRCVLVCVFFFVTIPAASHLIARAARRSGLPPAPGTVIDECPRDETGPS